MNVLEKSIGSHSSTTISRLPKMQRIFVNRTLNFANTRLIGFDMDHTLAPYRQETFEALAFHETLKKFIAAGYPEELMQLQFKPDFLIRGLLVDCERGNILKVDAHKYVKDAYHGHRRLTKEERHKFYNSEGFDPEKFVSIDTIFTLSEVQIFNEIVDFMSRYPGRVQKSYADVYTDVRRFIDLSHRDGSIKKEVLKDPGRFIEKDKHLSSTLVRLLDSGKSLFLLTNSQFDYTDAIQSYILDDAFEGFSRWRDYWEYVIVGASKPSFFTGSQPFYEVVEPSYLLRPHAGSLLPKKVYFGGNAALFEELTDYRGDEILYVGDHIYGDIIRSKDSHNWRTLLILHELETEIPKIAAAQALTADVLKVIQEKEAHDEDLQKIRSQFAANTRLISRAKEQPSVQAKNIMRLERENEKLRADLQDGKQLLKNLDDKIKSLIEARSATIHPVWGEMMKVGLERSRFANQVNSYACLYTSRVSNLRFYSPFKKFLSYHEVLPHE